MWIHLLALGLIAGAGGDAGQQPASNFEVVQTASKRQVSVKPLLQRVLEARWDAVRPRSKNARKKARAIEVQAAAVALEDGNEAEFSALMQKWLAYQPEAQERPRDDQQQLFMAQVALRVQALRRQQEQEQDDEDALLALMLA
jgi:hypothetical protein